jgi:hypothetical protein
MDNELFVGYLVMLYQLVKLSTGVLDDRYEEIQESSEQTFSFIEIQVAY